jgi:hypothetical protein
MAVGDIFTLFKNQTDNLLREAKKGIEEEGTKKIKETALKQLPTPQKIENDFVNLSQENPKKAEQYYTKTKRKLESILFKVENSRKKLGRLNEKIIKIDTKINDLSETAKVVNKFLPPIKTTISGLVASTATAGAPTLGSSASIPINNTREKLIRFIGYLVAVVGGLADIILTINKTLDASNLRVIIPSAIEKAEQLEEYILKLLDLLEKLYINFLLPLLEGYEEIDGGIDNIEDLYNQYPELETFLTSEGDVNLSDEELPYGVTNGISNVPPKFFRRYRKGPYTDIY